MSLINIQNLSFTYDGSYDPIFEDVSFQMDTDWKLGFTGRNGRGKTTFMKLLMGEYDYQGKINASVAFDYFPFEIKTHEQSTQDIIYALNPAFQDWEIHKELNLLQMDPEVLYRPFSSLSQGEQTKVMLAVLFSKENRFLLIDEPTNHLDSHGRDTVSAYLKRKKSFILISHDRNFLDGCVDHILSINKTSIDIQKGNFSSWQLNKDRQDQFELDENDKLRKDIDRLKHAALRTSGWSHDVEKTKYGIRGVDKGFIGHKSAKMMRRSKAIAMRRDRAIEEKSRLLKNLENADNIELFHTRHFQDTLIEANNLTLGYDQNKILTNLSLSIIQGERLVVSGINGSGKSTLLKALTGLTVPLNGTIKLASGLIISYVSQQTDHLKGSVQDHAVENGLNPALMKSILSKLDFNEIQFDKPMESFSEGQKKKVLLAKSICERAHVYIWDEPLNYIDVLSRIQIEDMILTHQPTMVLVEHDAAFTDSVGTNKLIL